MDTTPARQPMPNHPLLRDRARLEEILDVMYVQIQKITNPRVAPQHRASARADSGSELTLVGGESADDVLQDALLALLSYDPAQLTKSWEALAVGIAQNKAKQALRRATKGRRSSSSSDDSPVEELKVVPLTTSDNDGLEPIDTLSAEGADPEDEFIATRQQLILLRLARVLLDDRDRRIFFDVHHLGIPRAEVGRSLGLTGQRVGQIYQSVAKRLLEAAYSDPTFRMISSFSERRNP